MTPREQQEKEIREACIKAQPNIVVNANAQLIKFDHSVEYFTEYRPIRLADVLLAIHDVEPDKRPSYFSAGCDGAFYSVDYTYPDNEHCKVVHTGLGNVGVGWLLNKDSLTDQTDQTITFLHSLLSA